MTFTQPTPTQLKATRPTRDPITIEPNGTIVFGLTAARPIFHKRVRPHKNKPRLEALHAAGWPTCWIGVDAPSATLTLLAPDAQDRAAFEPLENWLVRTFNLWRGKRCPSCHSKIARLNVPMNMVPQHPFYAAVKHQYDYQQDVLSQLDEFRAAQEAQQAAQP
jgi:hypothetical protein